MWIGALGRLDLKHPQNGQLQGQRDSEVNELGVWGRVAREMRSADVSLRVASDAWMKSCGEKRKAQDQSLRLADLDTQLAASDVSGWGNRQKQQPCLPALYGLCTVGWALCSTPSLHGSSH